MPGHMAKVHGQVPTRKCHRTDNPVSFRNKLQGGKIETQTEIGEIITKSQSMHLICIPIQTAEDNFKPFMRHLEIQTLARLSDINR